MTFSPQQTSGCSSDRVPPSRTETGGGSGENWQLRPWGSWGLAGLSPSGPQGCSARVRRAAPVPVPSVGSRGGEGARAGRLKELFDNACPGWSGPPFCRRAGIAGLIFSCLGYGGDAVRSEEPGGHQIGFPGRGQSRCAGRTGRPGSCSFPRAVSV